MRIKMNKALIGLGVLVLINSPLHAEMKKLAQAGMQFLKIGVGARAVGMGESYIAVGQGADVIFWNPAGLAYVQGTEISFSHTSWIADIKHNAVAAATRLREWGVIGVSFITMDYGDIYRTAVDFNPANEYGYTGGKRFGGEKIQVNEYAFGLAYSKKFTDKFSLGVHAKYVSQDLGSTRVMVSGDERISNNKVSTMAYDFGTLYYIGIKDLRLAMSIVHFAGDLKYEREAFQLPLTFQVGVAMNIFSVFEMEENQSMTVSMEAIHPRDYTERYHVGAEYIYDNIFAFRAGYKFNYDEEGYTAGLGLIPKKGLFIDYAYADFGEAFGSVHRFTIGIKLD